jgi:hypothetical protein
MGPIKEAPPRSGARFIGAVYLFYFLTAIPAQLLLSRHLAVVGEALNLVSFAAYIAVTLLFYGLFKPVNMKLSLIAPYHLSPLWFFGPFCILIGWLTIRSTFLPRIIGALLVLAGVGWLVYLSPAAARALRHWIEGLGILAEASLMLWLLVKGVDESRWRERAGAGGTQ